MKVASLFLVYVSTTVSAYSVSVDRRQLLRTAIAGAGAVAVASPLGVNAMEACPKGSNNCLRTTWTPPSGASKADATASLKKVLESYPQEGQNKVDLGGYTVVEDVSSSGAGKIEFKSGIGNFAKFLNGGKPFVDDLSLEVASSGVVEVKSASRVGDSDLGVNQKRLSYLATKLRAEGWTAPDPTY